MSAAGIYNYHPKVEHPNKVFPQMESGGFQRPFFFGGSQVPTEFGVSTGSGFSTPYVSHTKHMRHMNAQSRGCGVTVHKNHKIYLPKHMSTIRY
jgi:hypothetical protein